MLSQCHANFFPVAKATFYCICDLNIYTFLATSDWISAELESTTEDYKLIEQMNRVTATKYSDMEQITANIAKGMTQLNIGYAQLQPYLEQIDHIDESVSRLEAAAFKLDAYSKRLEAKFKSLEKRNAN